MASVRVMAVTDTQPWLSCAARAWRAASVRGSPALTLFSPASFDLPINSRHFDAVCMCFRCRTHRPPDFAQTLGSWSCCVTPAHCKCLALLCGAAPATCPHLSVDLDAACFGPALRDRARAAG